MKYCVASTRFSTKTGEILRADFLNAVYFRRGLTCTLGLTNDLIDCDQPRAKLHLGKAKSNHVLKNVFIPRLFTIYQVVGKAKNTRWTSSEINCA